MQQPYPMNPGAKLDFLFPWADWLANEGDAIASYQIETGPGLTVESHSRQGGDVVVWLTLAEDVEVGVETWVRCKIETAGGGPRDARTMRLVAWRVGGST